MTVASARHILVETEEECLKLREMILNDGKEFSRGSANLFKLPI